jgi:hypothetical protein
MVDFAIVLRPNEKLASALPLTGEYVDGGVRSFNHTRFGPLTNEPIVVSIETKPEGESLQEAENQLAVWAAANLSRLRDLLDESKTETTDIPWLPLLLAQGPQWYFLFASRSGAGTTVSPCNSQELTGRGVTNQLLVHIANGCLRTSGRRSNLLMQAQGLAFSILCRYCSCSSNGPRHDIGPGSRNMLYLRIGSATRLGRLIMPRRNILFCNT